MRNNKDPFTVQTDGTENRGCLLKFLIIAVVVPLFLILVLAIILTIGTPTDSESSVSMESTVASVVVQPVAPKDEPQSTHIEQPTPKPDDNTISTEIDGCYVEFVDWEIVSNLSDELCLAVYYDYTNNTDGNEMFDYTIEDVAFQNGVELEPSFFHVNDESKSSGLKIQPGITIRVCSAFVLRDTSAVELQVSDWGDLDDEIIDSMTISIAEE